MTQLRYGPLCKPGYTFPPHPFLNAAAQARMEALNGHASVDELVQDTLDGSGFQAAAELRYALEVCRKSNALDYVIYDGDEKIASVRPQAASFEFQLPVIGRPLSRFASIRGDGGVMILESPLSDAIIEFALPDISLGRPAMQELLGAAGFLESDDECLPPAVFWEAHDLFFHRRSRLTPERRIGATWRFKDSLEAPPASKAAMAGSAIRLEIPKLAGPFQEVLEKRRSVRTPGPEPISAASLSTFLYRSVGIREPMGDGFLRPYPSGGGIHELEYYLAVHACGGLERGFYHYHAGEHALYRLSVEPAHVDQLVQQAVNSWGGRYPAPNVLITLAARVPRLAWKYEGMAYRTVLINAGCAIQTMYLVATEMNLAPCAIGNGDPGRFAAMTGLNALAETSVAEFALSSGGQW